jgi:hypothetical protein
MEEVGGGRNGRGCRWKKWATSEWKSWTWE